MVGKITTIEGMRPISEMMGDIPRHSSGTKTKDPRGKQESAKKENHKGKKTKRKSKDFRQGENKENHLTPWPFLETHDIDCHILENLLVQNDPNLEKDIEDILQVIHDRKKLSKG